MLVALVDRQAGPERGPERRRAHLAHSAADAGHRLIGKNRESFLVSSLLAYLPQGLVEREHLTRSNDGVVQVTGRSADVAYSLGRRSLELARAFPNDLLDAQSRKVVGRHPRLGNRHR